MIQHSHSDQLCKAGFLKLVQQMMPDLSQNQYEMMPLAGVHVIIIHCSDTFTHQQNIIMYFIY